MKNKTVLIFTSVFLSVLTMSFAAHTLQDENYKRFNKTKRASAQLFQRSSSDSRNHNYKSQARVDHVAHTSIPDAKPVKSNECSSGKNYKKQF